MNRSLRKGHLRRFGLLAILLPVGISAALMNRPKLPAGHATATNSYVGSDLQSWDEEHLKRHSFKAIEGLELGVDEVKPEFSKIAGRTLVLLPPTSLALPDVLVYWAKETPAPGPGDELPLGVRYLGDVSASWDGEYNLWPGENTAGSVVLFSLAHGEVVDAVAIEASAGGQ